MKVEVLLREFIAVAQKTAEDTPLHHRFGQGFNYVVEAVFDFNIDETARHDLKRVLARIDHKSIGLDLDLGFSAGSGSLCKYLWQELKSSGVRSVTLRRGDGLSFSCYGQS